MESHHPPCRPRLDDVARAAGVGIATVDRVVNARGGVRPETEARVLEAARRLGLRRLLPETPARRLRFVVLLQRRSLFYRALSDAFARAAAVLDPAISVYRVYVDRLDPALLARRIAAEGAACDGLAVVALDHPEIAAAIGRVRAPVVTLLTDLPESGRLAYVGIDNRQAGRAAGYLLGRLAEPGPVLCLLGSRGYRGHAEREAGLRAVLAERFPRLLPVLTVETLEDERNVARAVGATLALHPGLAAIYNTAGGNRGLVEALARHGRQGRVRVLAHELTPRTRRWLEAGVLDAVLDQNPELQAWRTLEVLLRHHGRLAHPGPGRPLAIDIVCAENLPPVS